MKQHQTFLEGVKEVLEDEDELKAICLHKKEDIEEIEAERCLKWRLKEMINEAEFSKKAALSIPENLKPELKDIVDDHNWHK